MEKNTSQTESLEIKVVQSIWTMWWFRLSLVFLLGFLSGLILFSSLRGCKKDSEISIPGKQAVLSDMQDGDSLRAGDVLRYDSPLAKAACKVRYSSKIVEVRVELSSLYPVKSVLEFDINNLAILEVKHVSLNDESTSIYAANFVQFNSVGENIYVIRLSNKNTLPHKLDFTISQNEVTIFKNAVQINSD
jgi:hypothetical protein